MSTGISVCLITKNCAKSLVECLESLQPFLRPDLGDEVVIVDTGSTDNTVQTAEQLGARVLPRPDLCEKGMLELVKTYLPDEYPECAKDSQFNDGFLSSFAVARQIGTDAATNEIIFWIDADDVLTGGKALRDHCLAFFQNPQNTVLFLPYDYSFDTDGKCNTILWRERILRKSYYVWKGNCHESMIPRDGKPQIVQKIGDPSCRLLHKHGRHHTFSDIRNYAILRKEYDSSDWKDPRTEFYLGNACRGLKRWSEAIRWYTLTLQRSGSRDDRLSACLNIGYCYTMFGRPWKAIDWFQQAIKIHTLEPRAYFGIARCFYELCKYNECVAWTQLGRAIEPPEHITSVDPQSFDFYPTIFFCLALKKLGQYEAAAQEAHRILSKRPDFKPAQELFEEITREGQREHAKKIVNTTLQLASSDTCAKEILERLKPEFRKEIRDFHMERVCTAPKKSITFFCIRTLEPWDPTSEADGVGGSEKMVIQLARRFAKRGWRVDVYGSPKEENQYKSFEGVTYRPVESFNPSLERDILILWRTPALLDLPFRANKIYVDMHDVANDGDFTPARMQRCAGVFWKSRFHRSTAPSCPEKKCIYTRNGIDVAHFEPAGERNLQKIVWCSSADRGLKGALLAWARLYNEFPNAEFHVFYGFTPLYVKHAADAEYKFFGDENADRHMLDYAEECYTIMDRLNIHSHGRVGHKELAAHLSTAGIWLYPTKFPEISCCAAMEAQAAGAFPICSDTGALKETVKYGTIVDCLNHDQIVNVVRGVFKKGHDLDTYRKEMSEWARSEYDLEGVVDQWLDSFEADKIIQLPTGPAQLLAV
jgi:glycosyltransferase involved in cell wall biosynthesis